MLKSLLGSTTAKITAVVFAAAMATGGLAVAGALPLQHTVAHVGADNHGSADVSGTVSGDDPTSTVTATVGEDHESVTATVFDHDADLPTSTVTPTVHESERPDVTETASAPNHGQCVSFAARNAEKMGLTGSQAGTFVSLVARDSAAVSTKVTDGGVPSAGCISAMGTAKLAALASPVTGTVSGQDSHSATTTDGASHDQHGSSTDGAANVSRDGTRG